MDKETTLILLNEVGIVPLFFHADVEIAKEVINAAYRGGARAFEFTNRGENAYNVFTELLAYVKESLPGLSLGIGTIYDAETAQKFIDAGTDYIICPGLVESVAEVADKNNMLWVPGCMTPSEIIRAETLGAKMIKLFPGNILGPGFLSAIKEIFPGLLFMPTGGVELDKDNIAGWFKAGVCAVGMGSKLITKALLEARDYTQITAATKQAMDIVQSVKSK